MVSLRSTLTIGTWKHLAECSPCRLRCGSVDNASSIWLPPRRSLGLHESTWMPGLARAEAACCALPNRCRSSCRTVATAKTCCDFEAIPKAPTASETGDVALPLRCAFCSHRSSQNGRWIPQIDIGLDPPGHCLSRGDFSRQPYSVLASRDGRWR